MIARQKMVELTVTVIYVKDVLNLHGIIAIHAVNVRNQIIIAKNFLLIRFRNTRYILKNINTTVS